MALRIEANFKRTATYVKDAMRRKKVAKVASYSNCGLELCMFPEGAASKVVWSFDTCLDLELKYVARNVLLFFSGPNNQPSVHSFAKWLKSLDEEIVEGPKENRYEGYWQRTYIWKPSERFRYALSNAWNKRENERSKTTSSDY